MPSRLCENLLRSAVPDERIVLRLIVNAPPLTLDQAVPCGMVLNELVSNALKHAYPDGQAGEIRVEFTAAGCERRLVVSDNGVGLPPQQASGPSSLGLTVVAALVRQLGGDLSIRGDGGARFVITFPAGEHPSHPEVPAPSERWTPDSSSSPAITASKS